jgi:hypothetical protein
VNKAIRMNGENRNAYGSLVGKTHGNRTVGRSRSRWQENIKMNRREIG